MIGSERRGYLMRGRYGSEYMPTFAASLFMGIGIVRVGIIWTVYAAKFAGVFSLFGVLFIAVGIGMSVLMATRAHQCNRAEKRYHRRRRTLDRKRER